MATDANDTFNRGIQTFRGTKDYFGDEARWRISVIETIRKSLELFGFEPLETPAIENERTLKGKYGDEGDKKRYRLSLPYPQEAGLRYDQTVPLARFMAMNWNQFPLPYRRYVIGPVWRDESVQAGRLRQFYQCDFDTVGSDSPIIDAEVVAINYTILSKLGFTDTFRVRVNDRRLLDAMAEALGILDPSQKLALFRAWDKLEKTSLEAITQELVLAGLPTKTLRSFSRVTEKLLQLNNQPSDRLLSVLSRLFKNESVATEIKRLEFLTRSILDMGVPEINFAISPLLARGLDYYTGPIFETVVEKAGVGSITGGGRFDKLIADMGGPDLPASGSSFGLERIMTVMEELGLKPTSAQSTKVLVTVFDPDSAQLVSRSYQAASALRLDNVNTEIYTGANRRLSAQIDIARRKNISLVVIVGPDELSSNTVTVKNLQSKTQSTIPFLELSDCVKTLLA